MNVYHVRITEMLERTVEIEAEDKLSAEQTVSDNWRNGEYILDADNFTGVTFEIARVEKDEHEIIWDKYLKYLKEWAEIHKESAFMGMSPAGYDEWDENEYRNLLMKNVRFAAKQSIIVNVLNATT